MDRIQGLLAHFEGQCQGRMKAYLSQEHGDPAMVKAFIERQRERICMEAHNIVASRIQGLLNIAVPSARESEELEKLFQIQAALETKLLERIDAIVIGAGLQAHLPSRDVFRIRARAGELNLRLAHLAQDAEALVEMANASKEAFPEMDKGTALAHCEHLRQEFLAKEEDEARLGRDLYNLQQMIADLRYHYGLELPEGVSEEQFFASLSEEHRPHYQEIRELEELHDNLVEEHSRIIHRKHKALLDAMDLFFTYFPDAELSSEPVYVLKEGSNLAKVRGDGNCFYYAATVALLEEGNSSLIADLIERLTARRSPGYEKVIEALKRIQRDPQSVKHIILDNSVMRSFARCLRDLAEEELTSHPDEYEWGWSEESGYQSFHDYAADIHKMGLVYADDLTISALQRVLGIDLQGMIRGGKIVRVGEHYNVRVKPTTLA